MANIKTRTCWLIYRARRRWWRRVREDDYRLVCAVWAYDRMTALGWAALHYDVLPQSKYQIDVREIPMADPLVLANLGIQAPHNPPLYELISGSFSANKQ